MKPNFGDQFGDEEEEEGTFDPEEEDKEEFEWNWGGLLKMDNVDLELTTSGLDPKDVKVFLNKQEISSKLRKINIICEVNKVNKVVLEFIPDSIKIKGKFKRLLKSAKKVGVDWYKKCV